MVEGEKTYPEWWWSYRLEIWNEWEGESELSILPFLLSDGGCRWTSGLMPLLPCLPCHDELPLQIRRPNQSLLPKSALLMIFSQQREALPILNLNRISQWSWRPQLTTYLQPTRRVRQACLATADHSHSQNSAKEDWHVEICDFAFHA